MMGKSDPYTEGLRFEADAEAADRDVTTINER